ncbi:MAG: hypothetical protein RLZZ367_1927 [Bacteroidota bacterium]
MDYTANNFVAQSFFKQPKIKIQRYEYAQNRIYRVSGLC